MMEITILKARHYVRIGAKDAGDEVVVDDDYGQQLCDQHFAEKKRKARPTVTKTAAGETEKESNDA